MVTIYERMQARFMRLEEDIQKIKQRIDSMPVGKLVCTKNGKTFKWYVSVDGKLEYIPKAKREYAQQLAIKKYCVQQLECMTQEYKAEKSYLKHCSKQKEQMEENLLLKPGYKELLQPFFSPTSEINKEWLNETYDKNPKYPDQLTIKTSSGNMVRSKSEALIDMLLYVNKIPFRYECCLDLNGTVIYPDFTILKPKTGEIFYWEHFGIMDDLTYVNKACSKISLYSRNGIIPSVNLITTYETQEKPLDIDMVQLLINHYFM